MTLAKRFRALLVAAAVALALGLSSGAAFADGHEAAENPCNPCGAAENPCNPCGAAENPCNPCGAAENPCSEE